MAARKDRRDWYALVCDRFDIRHFGEIRKQSKRLREVAQEAKELPTGATLPQDIYNALYKFEPPWNDKMAEEFRINRAVLEQLVELPEFQGLHATTQLDVTGSAVAVPALADAAFTILREKQEEYEERKKALNEARENAKQNPSPETERQEQEAQEKMEQTERAMRTALREGVRSAQKQVDDTNNALSMMWGDDPGAEGDAALGDKLKLAEELASNPKLRQIAEILGRIKLIAKRVQREKLRQESAEYSDVVLGNEIARMLPTEAAKLRHPLLKKDWMRRYVERSLMEYDLQEKKPIGRGPIVACIDESGSMAGLPDQWAKAVLLALAMIARKQKRGFAVIHFSSKHEIAESRFPGGAMTPEDIRKLAVHFYGGGTEFEAPLTKAVAILSESEFEKGDLIFITDGQAYTGEHVVEYFKKQKADRQFRAVLCQVGHEPPQHWSDLFDSTVVTQPNDPSFADTEALRVMLSV